ncbi:MAG: histidinol phosphate phosphatase domain-containing protein [Candidatus Theseobacter exili]|nr:histidinol phosphate phosphatase domain-containing protein [Candidatus Theseobacter exili]
MIDLHTHTYLSDGVLGPAELARRAFVQGYKTLCISDHADMSNIDFIVPRLVDAARELQTVMPLRIIPGVELTHIPCSLIAHMVGRARSLGATIVLVHGETPVEPVEPGTNRAAIDAGVDILAHPGLISEDAAVLAAKKGVCLEITTRKGHSLTNGWIASMASKTDARLVLNTDSHEPKDLLTEELFNITAKEQVYQNRLLICLK